MNDFYEFEDSKMKGLRDWRKALRTPTTYRVGNTVRIQSQFLYYVALIVIFLIVLFFYNLCTNQVPVNHQWVSSPAPYNSTYPLTRPIRSGDVITYKIGIVADLDTNSKSSTTPNTYISYLKTGFLSYNPVNQYMTITWDKSKIMLSSTYSQKGRGMELSELIVYDGKLVTFDDRSGMVFTIIGNKVVPWLILSDGEGHSEKGFKAEWATVKDKLLYVGSMGKEWTTASGEFQNFNPMWVKAINMYGEIQHLNWVHHFKAIRESIGILWPGYTIHESGVWSSITEKWHFLPRRCSKEAYNETKDEVMGCNYLVTANNDFSVVNAKVIVKHQPTHGFSSFKFIPDSNDKVIVALKTIEFEGKTSTYITAFNTDGTILLEDTFVENLKYEGFEFI